jgi:aminoglycoside phosphotransferase (APT) family kinase protein
MRSKVECALNQNHPFPMDTRQEQPTPINKLVAQLTNEPLQNVLIERKPLNGGREAAGVSLVTARYQTPTGRPRLLRFVVKHLTGRPAREAAVYEDLVAHHASELAPRLLAVERFSSDTTFLFLEAMRRVNLWPWREVSTGGDLLTRLAQFHAATEHTAIAIPKWDYEAELGVMAEETRAALDQCRGNPDLSFLARDLPSLDKIILALPELRRQLLAERPFGRRMIHGDVHPGNALVCRRGRGCEPVLLDWGRARVGSPLEDVSSWLRSLSYWEPAGRRYHDTLLATYLSAFGLERQLTPSVRAAYWMAAASNALSGALLCHLRVAQDRRQLPRQRVMAFDAARDTLRVIRRARAWWN